MITLAQAKEALSRSGYLIESRVEALLRRRSYYVESNKVYPDATTGVSREYDTFAIGATKAGPGGFDYLFRVLVIECVNNPEPLVLITKSAENPRHHSLEIKMSGLPVKLLNPDVEGMWIRLVDMLAVEEYHHYCNGRIATQFCSFQQKKQKPNDWFALHEDSQFDSFRKVSAATEHLVADHFLDWKAWAPDPLDPEHANINLQVYYPILVVQGELLEATPHKGDVRLAPRTRMMFRRGEYVHGEHRSYQIDVVQEKHLPRLLAQIEREGERMAGTMRDKHELLRASADRIVKLLGDQANRDLPGLRAAMDLDP